MPRWDFVQLSGTWARENHVVARRLRPGRQSVGSDRGASSHQHNPFIALRARDDDRGRRRGLRLQPRLLGQLHRRGRGRPVRHDPRPDRHQPEHLQLDARAGRRVRDARGDPRLLGRGARGDERRAPRPLPRAAGARDAGATRRDRSSSTTGRRPTSTSTSRSWSRSRRRRATSGSSCSSSTTAGSASATSTRFVARRLVRRPAQAAERPRRARREGRGARASGSACGSSPR